MLIESKKPCTECITEIEGKVKKELEEIVSHRLKCRKCMNCERLNRLQKIKKILSED
jgi:hypothetical protein